MVRWIIIIVLIIIWNLFQSVATGIWLAARELEVVEDGLAEIEHPRTDNSVSSGEGDLEEDQLKLVARYLLHHDQLSVWYGMQQITFKSPLPSVWVHYMASAERMLCVTLKLHTWASSRALCVWLELWSCNKGPLTCCRGLQKYVIMIQIVCLKTRQDCNRTAWVRTCSSSLFARSLA